MFTPEMQYTPIHKLSGGEKRRIGLMMVLIKNPNFLILDEPTNDLDLTTLQKLEEFLSGFGGCLIIVSHDRFFMDRLVDHYFIFEGDGEIKDHHGTFMEYRELQAEELSAQKKERLANEKKSEPSTPKKKPNEEVKKLSFQERKDFQKLEKEIGDLEKEKSEIERALSGGKLSPNEVRDQSERYGELTQSLDEKTMKWLEMAERA